MDTHQTEALIIGSGFGAAAPALRLAEAGVQVIMIEKGPMIDPRTDFKQTQDPRHYLKYLKSCSGENISFTYAEGYGGGSGFFEMVCLRAPSRAFEQTDAGGRAVWPDGLNRKTLDPYYERAERMTNVHQIAVEDVPKTGAVFSRLMNNLGYSCDRARYAVGHCLGAAFCVCGCVFGAKQSLHVNYLPQAENLGMRVFTSMEAFRVRPLEDDTSQPSEPMAPRYEVVCRNPVTGERVAFRAAIVVFGAGTIGTAALLMRSQSHLPALSSALGRNITFNGSVKSAGLLPPDFPEGDMYTGRSHPGMISYALLETEGITISTAKPLPLDIIATARLVRKGRENSHDFWGKANVLTLKQFRRRGIVLYALGLTPHTAELRLKSDGTLITALDLENGVRQYSRRVTNILHSIIERNGGSVLNPQFIDGSGSVYKDLHFSSAHMMGSCRMAQTREHGVTDRNGEIFGYPGLYVTDGAAVPSSLAVNSSLTILANAERVGEYLAKRYGRS